MGWTPWLASGPVAGILVAGCQALGGAAAPAECGFPAGTPLEYAGRSTTGALGVQEVIGDPMADDPADIYITRDELAQGELRGRLVCAVFVDPPGFVEVTVHPADGGRVEPPPPAPPVSPPPDGLPVADAIRIALASLDQPDGWVVTVTEAGPLGRLMDGAIAERDWAAGLPVDRWAWRIFLVRGDEGLDVVIDGLDGTVLGTVRYIVN